MAYNRRSFIQLYISKGDERKICSWYGGGAARPGGYQNPVSMEFREPKPTLFGDGAPFQSEKQAMWFWHQWCKDHPEETEGWTASAEEWEE